MTSAQLAPAILFPFILWRVYVRVRRNVGRQPLVVKSLKIRIWIFALLCVLFGAGASLQPGALLAFLGGLVGSVLLAWFGVRLTRFERTQNGDFYTPNTVIGVTLSLLLVGRVVYRFMTLYSAGVLRPVPGQLGGAQSALTLAILGLTFGYYVAYYVGVLTRARHLDGAPAEPLS
jgi:hypothetical protein